MTRPDNLADLWATLTAQAMAFDLPRLRARPHPRSRHMTTAIVNVKIADLEPVKQALQDAATEVERLTEERDLWRTLAEARNGILAAYRTGGRAPGKHIDTARAAVRRLEELGADQ